MFCGHVCARLYGQMIRTRVCDILSLTYKSLPFVVLIPIIGTLMNFFALVACSKPAQLNNPRHEATNEW